MLKPLNDHVVLEKKESKKETTTQSGIILSNDKDERQVTARVIAVGPGKLEDGKRIPMDVNVGDEVVFKSYAATDVTVGDETFMILKESDILAVVEA